MDNASLAAQAVANGPVTAAPPSFDGHGWLVVLNMGSLTAGAIITTMVLAMVIAELWRGRREDAVWKPARVALVAVGLILAAIAGGCAAEALTLWGWNPNDPAATGGYLLAKRLVHPICVWVGIAGGALFGANLPGLCRQLRKDPLEVHLWPPGPVLIRMAAVTVLSLIAAAGVVVTR